MKKMKIVISILVVVGIISIISGLLYKKEKRIPSESFQIMSSRVIKQDEDHYYLKCKIKNITKGKIKVSRITLEMIDENEALLSTQTYKNKTEINPDQIFEFEVVYPAINYKKLTIKYTFYQK